MISVLIADDHSVVREGLRRVLEDEQDITVCAEAADGEEVLEMIGAFWVAHWAMTLAFSFLPDGWRNDGDQLVLALGVTFLVVGGVTAWSMGRTYRNLQPA